MLSIARKDIQIHGLSKTRLYRIYSKMKQRCYAPDNHEYRYYGGRGITICDEWLQSFVAFYDWAMDHGYHDSLTIDRIDSNKGYSPDNCRWLSMKGQNNNRRCNLVITLNGKTQTLSEWSRELNLPYGTIHRRITVLGWSIEEALTYNRNARIHRRNSMQK